MKRIILGLTLLTSAVAALSVARHPASAAAIAALPSAAHASSASSCSYPVQVGDTLGNIAPRFGLAWPTLYAMNRGVIGDNPNAIHVGEVFNVCAGSSNGSVQSMIQQTFGAYAWGAQNVARCESGFDPNAWNGTPIGDSHASGVFQILYPSTWGGTSYRGYSPFNAWANIQAAHEIFVRDGYSWREWACQP